MNPVYEKLMSCYECVRSKTDFVPEVAIILGSGLGDYVSNIKVETEVSYGDIEGYPISEVVLPVRRIWRQLHSRNW